METPNCANKVAGTARITKRKSRYRTELRIRIFITCQIILRLPDVALLRRVARIERLHDALKVTQTDFLKLFNRSHLVGERPGLNNFAFGDVADSECIRLQDVHQRYWSGGDSVGAPTA